MDKIYVIVFSGWGTVLAEKAFLTYEDAETYLNKNEQNWESFFEIFKVNIQNNYGNNFIDDNKKGFEKWWDIESSSVKGKSVLVSANEYLHMKSIAYLAYIAGYNKSKSNKHKEDVNA